MRPELLLAALFFISAAYAEPATYHLDGHVKARYIGQWFPSDSVFNELTGSSSQDFESGLRLNFEADKGPWSFRSAWQLFALYGDRIEYTRQLPPLPGVIFDRLPNDDRRLADMTWVLEDSGKFAALHRFDRMWFGYAGEKLVVKAGRQAISWGNGFFFSPMDIVNPFDPTTIDTEFKAGDDMLYGQYLLDNGHDVQAAWVVRRDLTTGNVENDESTVAVKYHGIVGDGEFDLLVAQSFGDTTVAIGGNRSIGGAVWRGDLVVTDAESDTVAQLVTSASYSWVWGGKNVSGALEYYYNGFGQAGGDYSDIGDNTELLERIARGEIFALGRHYIAGALTVELTPLWTLSPTLFTNLEDPSAFLQLITQYSLGDNSLFLGSLNVPIGANGTEYGGIEAGVSGQYLSTDVGVFTQLAWYF